jgi:hypothetical protein
MQVNYVVEDCIKGMYNAEPLIKLLEDVQRIFIKTEILASQHTLHPSQVQETQNNCATELKMLVFIPDAIKIKMNDYLIAIERNIEKINTDCVERETHQDETSSKRPRQ